MEDISITGELIAPKAIDEGYMFFDCGHWCIKDDSPDWAKKEYEDFCRKLNPVPDENGIITYY